MDSRQGEERPTMKQKSSKYIGVCYNSKNKKWQAALHIGSKYVHLGLHEDEETAARVFDLKKLLLKGPNAKKLNFPEESRRQFFQLHPEFAAQVQPGSMQAASSSTTATSQQQASPQQPQAHAPGASSSSWPTSSTQQDGLQAGTPSGIPCANDYGHPSLSTPPTQTSQALHQESQQLFSQSLGAQHTQGYVDSGFYANPATLQTSAAWEPPTRTLLSDQVIMQDAEPMRLPATQHMSGVSYDNFLEHPTGAPVQSLAACGVPPVPGFCYAEQLQKQDNAQQALAAGSHAGHLSQQQVVPMHVDHVTLASLGTAAAAGTAVVDHVVGNIILVGPLDTPHGAAALIPYIAQAPGAAQLPVSQISNTSARKPNSFISVPFALLPPQPVPMDGHPIPSLPPNTTTIPFFQLESASYPVHVPFTKMDPPACTPVPWDSPHTPDMSAQTTFQKTIAPPQTLPQDVPMTPVGGELRCEEVQQRVGLPTLLREQLQAQEVHVRGGQQSLVAQQPMYVAVSLPIVGISDDKSAGGQGMPH